MNQTSNHTAKNRITQDVTPGLASIITSSQDTYNLLGPGGVHDDGDENRSTAIN